MTAQRQERYGWRRQTAFFALLSGLLAAISPSLTVQASTTERVVTERYSGLAIDGFDPVAYFTDGAAVLGLPEFEASEGGAVWRFHNEGNQAWFKAHPEIYAPQFGGYDPADLVRGVTCAGNPRFWVVAGNRLYLFNREKSRDEFAANPARFLKDAEARWPELQQALAQ